MKKPILNLSLVAFAISGCSAVVADVFKPSYSVGLARFAISQTTEQGSYYQDYIYTGVKISGAVNLNNHIQGGVGFYNTSETQFSDLSLKGYNLRVNFGKGFTQEGFKIYGSFGLYNDQLDNGVVTENVKGLELGGGLGYNFGNIAVDWGYTLRDSSEYETERMYGENMDVTTTSAFLALSANF